MLALIPIVATIYDIIAYSSGGSFITLNITTHMPKTRKFAIKVKVFLKLLSLSLRFREQVNDGTKLIWLICNAAHPMLKRDGKIM